MTIYTSFTLDELYESLEKTSIRAESYVEKISDIAKKHLKMIKHEILARSV